jgi:hypothetical protein
MEIEADTMKKVSGLKHYWDSPFADVIYIISNKGNINNYIE